LGVPDPALSGGGVFHERAAGAVGERQSALRTPAVDLRTLDMQRALRLGGADADVGGE